MTSAGSERDPLEQLADEFARRYRRGEQPTLDEYVAKHPALAEQIRELFPALVEMEQLRQGIGATGFPHEDSPVVQPEQLGDYRILRQVARGGMGVVYEAVQESLGRHVALKVLPLHGLMNPTQLERFRREARAAAKLHHSNIVPVFGVGEDQGIHYYAMQFIQGQSLDLVLRELRRLRGKPDFWEAADSSSLAVSAAYGLLTGRRSANTAPSPEPGGAPAPPAARGNGQSGSVELPPASANTSAWGSKSESQFHRSVARLGFQVAEALAYAHEQGILHRDIKPSNLLLDTHGTVWVTDFGLAKDEESDELTRTGDIVGTLRYMAPERFDGQADARSDVYGLGATLYELLVLVPPLVGQERAELLRQIAADQPRPLRRIDRSIPVELETIVAKALAKHPDERYASAAELADDLDRYLEDRPILARRPTLRQVLQKWSRRHRGVVTTATVSAALACIVAVTILVTSNLRIRRAFEAQTRAKNQLSEALDVNEQTLYSYRVALAHREWLANRVARADALLDECPEALRNWEWHYLKRLGHGERLTYPEHGRSVVLQAVFSPSGDQVASASYAQIRLWEAATGKTIRTIKLQTADVSDVAFSPDGSLLASAGSAGTTTVRQANSGKELFTFDGHSGRVADIAFSPNGQLLATASVDGTIGLWNPRTGERLRTLTGHQSGVYGVAFSPDSRQMASSSNDGTVRIWDIDRAESIRCCTMPVSQFPKFTGFVALSPDGRRVAAGYWEAIRIWDVDTAEQVCHIRSDAGIAHGGVFGPDGRWFAVGYQDSTIRFWDTETGQELGRLRGHTRAVYRVSLSPDGVRLVSASGDGTAKIWDVPGQQVAATAPEIPAGYCSAVAFSRNGRLLASAHEDHSVRIWDASNLDPLRAISRAHQYGVLCVAFGDDGRLASGSSDKVIRIWDPSTGKQLAICRNDTGTTSLAFAPKTNLLASGGLDATIRLWDPTTGREIRTMRGHSDFVSRIAFSPDGSRLASAGEDHTLRVWDVASGQELVTITEHRGQVQGVAFSPDGRHIASGSADSTVRIWDAVTGKPLRRFGAHVGAVGEVAYSRDGRRLAAGTGNGTVVVWDVATGREALTLKGHEQHVRSVTFSSDGHRLASAALDGSIRLWDGTPLGQPVGAIALPTPGSAPSVDTPASP